MVDKLKQIDVDVIYDLKQVDKNVTRHLKDELNSPTWNVMILHYLGLDHIGHVAGPNSPLVKPKLKEMDNVIRQIYNAMEQWVMKVYINVIMRFGGGGRG